MATGIPATKRKSSQDLNDHSAIALSYQGKIPEEQIVMGEAAKLSLLFESAPQTKNRVIFGDNLKVLRSLLLDSSIRGKVSLIYIDPPYSTGFHFHSRQQKHAYSDHLEGAEYLEFLRQRLVLLERILADNGSIYVHLDANMVFHVKVLMDEIFGVKNFRNFITRRKTNPKNYTRKSYGNISDYILFYTKSDNYTWNQQTESLSDTSLKEYRHIEEGTGRHYMRVPVHAPGVRNGATGGEWRGMLPPPGKHWQYPPDVLDELDARGEIYWSSNGNPRRKVYLDQHRGVGVQDIWWDFKDAHNQNIRITGYPTEKNPDLIKRIILASSNEGDIVMDAFGGSGTVADVASRSGRQWITIDNSPLAIETTINRLINGVERMGDYVSKNGNTGAEQLRLLDNSEYGDRDFGVYIDSNLDLLNSPDVSVEKWRSFLADC